MQSNPLDRNSIVSRLTPASRSALNIHVHDTVASTNDNILDLHGAGSCHGAAVFS